MTLGENKKSLRMAEWHVLCDQSASQSGLSSHVPNLLHDSNYKWGWRWGAKQSSAM